MNAFPTAGSQPAGRVFRARLQRGALSATILVAAGCQAVGPAGHAATSAKGSAKEAAQFPTLSQPGVARRDTSDTSSRVITAMEISQAPVTSAQVAAALAAAAQASQAVLDANAVLKAAQESETKAAANAAAAADALNKANQTMADAQAKLAAAMAAADQAALSGSAAEQAATAALLAGAKADAAAAAATQAAAQASAAATQSALAQATAQAATAAAAQAVAKANDAAAQSSLAQAQSQAAAGLAADAKNQSQAAADQAALALARANSDSAQLNSATASAAAAAAAAAQALATANEVAAKLAPTPTPVPAPVIQVTTYGGSGKGLANGLLASALFDHPNGLALEPSGNLLVADAGNNQIRRISSDGVVTTVAGGARGYVDGLGANVAFNNPYGVAASADGVIYVADTNNHCIRKIAVDGTVSTLAGNGVKGFVDGTGTVAQFSSPFSLDVDSLGNVYVADAGNNRIRKISPVGVVTTLAGSGKPGKLDGAGLDAQFYLPSDVAVDGAGNVLIADLGNNEVRRIGGDGRVSTVAGNGATGAGDGAGPIAQFNAPSGLALGQDGAIYVADTQNNRLRKISPSGQVSTVAGMGTKGAADGACGTASFNGPSDLAQLSDGTLVVADTENCRLRAVR